MSAVLQTKLIHIHTPGYDYGDNVSTILNVNPDYLEQIQLPIADNESFGVEWKNVVFNVNYPITLQYTTSPCSPYDVRNTLEVWYDVISGDPPLNFTFYTWKGETDTYNIPPINITNILFSNNVDLTRVRKVRFTTFDGVKEYVNYPGNNFILESNKRYIYNEQTSFYTSSTPQSSLSTTRMVFDYKGLPATFQIFANGDWSLSDNATWFSCSPTSGSGISVVTVDPAYHKLLGTRTGPITVNVNGNIETVTVVQYDRNA